MVNAKGAKDYLRPEDDFIMNYLFQFQMWFKVTHCMDVRTTAHPLSPRLEMEFKFMYELNELN